MNVPNALSILRICLVPVFVRVFFGNSQHPHIYAMVVFLIAGATDIIDGKIARKYNLITTLGKILDPLADKLMVFTALLCCTIDKVIPMWATIFYFSKEIIHGSMGLILYRKIKDVPPSNILGKLGTVSFYITIAVCLLFTVPKTAQTLMLSLSFLIIVSALISYIVKGLGMNKKTSA